ncbi:AP-3 complex subunit mu [Plasmodium brasilianum]|uniref:AP-3 complex subunit mu n=1 Tax=Plasmodium brasilianum TaxID=5824 RepID=A0ACB9Y5J7_PLABR|nr:AP-3 complex subunit mu [Plasmodium brasilianum]
MDVFCIYTSGGKLLTEHIYDNHMRNRSLHNNYLHNNLKSIITQNKQSTNNQCMLFLREKEKDSVLLGCYYNSFVYIVKRDNLFFISLKRNENNPGLIVEVIQEIVISIKKYFNTDCLTEHIFIRNYSSVNFLINEILAQGGKPSLFVDSILRSLVKSECTILNETLRYAPIPSNLYNMISQRRNNYYMLGDTDDENNINSSYSNGNSINSIDALNVFWRSNNINYSINEIFIDIIEYVHCIVYNNNYLLHYAVQGNVHIRCNINGFTLIKLYFNMDIDLSKSIVHFTVRYDRLYNTDGTENERNVLYFVPLNEEYILMKYYDFRQLVHQRTNILGYTSRFPYDASEQLTDVLNIQSEAVPTAEYRTTEEVENFQRTVSEVDEPNIQEGGGENIQREFSPAVLEQAHENEGAVGKNTDENDEDENDEDENDEDGKNADMKNADMKNADMKNADMKKADMKKADMKKTDMKKADKKKLDRKKADRKKVDKKKGDRKKADRKKEDAKDMFMNNSVVDDECKNMGVDSFLAQSAKGETADTDVSSQRYIFKEYSDEGSNDQEEVGQRYIFKEYFDEENSAEKQADEENGAEKQIDEGNTAERQISGPRISAEYFITGSMTEGYSAEATVNSNEEYVFKNYDDDDIINNSNDAEDNESASNNNSFDYMESRERINLNNDMNSYIVYNRPNEKFKLPIIVKGNVQYIESEHMYKMKLKVFFYNVGTAHNSNLLLTHYEDICLSIPVHNFICSVSFRSEIGHMVYRDDIKSVVWHIENVIDVNIPVSATISMQIKRSENTELPLHIDNSIHPLVCNCNGLYDHCICAHAFTYWNNNTLIYSTFNFSVFASLKIKGFSVTGRKVNRIEVVEPQNLSVQKRCRYATVFNNIEFRL